MTDVPRAADVAVAAGNAVVGMLATLDGVTAIVGAGIAVVTAQRSPGPACATGTLVGGGADVAVAANKAVIDVITSCLRIADVVCAGIAVVATQRPARHALAALAGVLDGAGIVVRAARGIRCMDAAFAGVATVIGARIAVVAA